MRHRKASNEDEMSLTGLHCRSHACIQRGSCFQSESRRLARLRRAADAAQYSSLDQIDRSNVKQLQVAWRYSTGDHNKYFFNPVEVDGVLYVLAHNNSIVALDAGSGKEIWVHPAPPDTKIITNRGINYWKARIDRTGVCCSPVTISCGKSTAGQANQSFLLGLQGP